MLRRIMAELLEGAAKKVKPRTLIEKGKEIGIDVEKLKLGDKSLIKKVLKELGFNFDPAFIKKSDINFNIFFSYMYRFLPFILTKDDGLYGFLFLFFLT